MNSSRKNSIYILGLLIFVSLLSFLFSIILYNSFEKTLFEKLTTVIGVVTEDSKDLEIQVMNHLKDGDSHYIYSGRETLRKYGYDEGVFIFQTYKKKVILASALFSILIGFTFYIYIKMSNKIKKKNIEKLKDYVENINKGDYSLNISVEDDYSILSDELYKTVVSLRELKEKAVKDKIALKDNMSDISHQLKTPITSINIMAELMESDNSEKEKREYIYRLNRQVERLEILTSTLLTMSKLDAGTLDFRKEVVDIENIINLSIEPIMPLLEKNNIKINIRGKSETIEGDGYWLSEAFLNIIKNCVEHLEKDGEINISLESNPIFVGIKIEDNGDGFLKEDLPYIFDRFYKGKNSSKDSIGIGLSMAKVIIEKHNGEISAENGADGGAIFKIKFY